MLLKRIFDGGLDELAVSAHGGAVVRMVVTSCAAVVFALMLPWQLCAGWAALVLALEVQAWFATRQQFLLRPVGWRTQLWHVSGLAASSVAWVAAGAMLWMSGSAEGAV